MKKVVSIALVLVLVLSLSVSVFAAGSPVAPRASEGRTAAMPVVQKTEADGKTIKVVITEVGEANTLDADAKKAFKEAQDALADAAPEDMSAEYFFYAESEVLPYTMTLRQTTAKKAAAKLFKDSAWTDLKTTVNAGGTISVEVTGNGPIAVFCEK